MAKPKYSVKNNSYTTHWLKNAMKSIGASYGDSLKELAPNLYDISSASARTTMNVVKSMRANKNGVNRISNTLQSNKYVQFAQTAYRNALVDLKTGNFNNTERGFGSDSEELAGAVEDAMSGFSFGDDGAENVNVNIIGGSDNTALAGIQESMQAQAASNVKMQKASMDAFVAVNAASMQQVGQIGAEVLNQLTNINSQLAAMVQYNNSTMTRYIEASMAYMERSGASLEKMSGGDKSVISAMDVIGSATKGGINLGRYKQMVKQQFKGMVDNSEFGIIKTLLDDDMFIESFVNNPLGASTKMLTSYMMPKMLKSTIESMETTLNNFLPDMLMQIADLTKDNSSGISGMLKRAIGNVFGVKVERENSFKGATVERGAIPFDGETKHAITEIITKELREQTGYLQIIAERYNKDAKSTVKANAEYWDWNSNKYIKGSQIDENITKKMSDAVINAMSDTFFGKNLQGAVDVDETKEGKNDVQSTINELYTLMEQQTEHLDLGDIVSLVEKTNGSKRAKNIVNKWLKEMREKTPNDFNNRSTAQLSGQSAMKEIREDIKSNPTLYHLFDSSYADTEDIDKKYLEMLGIGDEKKKRNISNRNFYKDVSGMYQGVERKSKVGKSYSENGKTDFGQQVFTSISSMMNSASGIMNSIMSGDTKGVIDQGSRLIIDGVKQVGTSISKTLFGTKNDAKVFENGIFSDVANGFTDMVSNLKYKITGKGYTDTKGKSYADNDDTVIGKLRQVSDTIKDSVVEKLFGRTKDENGQYSHTGHGIVDTIGDQFKEATSSFKEFLFGSNTGDHKTDRRNKGLLQNVKNAFDKNFYGGKKKESSEADSDKAVLGNAMTGIMSGGLLGYMVGGPIVGSLAGLAISIAKNSDRFKTFLFGEEDGLTLANGKTAKKQGLFGKMGNYLNANVLGPLKNELAYITDDVKTTIKHDILAPVAFTAEYFAGKVGKMFSFVGNEAKEGMHSIGAFMGETLATMFPGVTEKAGDLLSNGVNAVYEVGARIVKAPFKFMAATVKALGIADRIKAFFKPIGDIIKTGTHGVFKFTKDVIKDTVRLALSPASLAFKGIKKGASFVGNKLKDTKMGKLGAKIKANYDAYDADLDENDKIIKKATNGEFKYDTNEAREWLKKNNPEALDKLKDSLDIRMKLNKREGKLEHMKNRQFRTMNRKAQKNASKIAKWTKGQFSEDSEDAREWLKLHDHKKLKELDDEPFEFFKKENEKASIAKNGKSSKGMSEAQLARANLMTMSEQGQTNSLLAKIWDILFKQTHEGKDKEQVDAEEAEQNFLGDIKKNRPNKRKPLSKAHKRKLIQEYYAKGGESATGKEKAQIIRELAERYNCTQKAVKEAIANGDEGGREEAGALDKEPQKKIFGSYALADIADFGSSIFSKIKGVFSDPSRQHAKGGKLKKGLNLVGEKGPELVDWSSGKVDNTEDTINKLGEASSDENRKARKGKIATLFSSLSGKDKRRNEVNAERASIAKEEDADMRDDSSKSALDKAKTAKELMKEKEEEKYKAAMLAASERTASATEEGTEATKKHSFNWSKIFSKKGLITGAIIAGALLLKDKLPAVFNAVGKVIGLIGKGVGWILNLFGNAKSQDHNENGESAGEVLGDVIDNYTDGNLLQLQEDGSASSLTESNAKFLGRTGLNIWKGAYAAKNGLKSVSTLDKLAAKVPGLGIGAKVANAEKKVGEIGYKAVDKVANSKVGKTVSSGLKDAGAKILGKSDWAKMGGSTSVMTLEDGTKAMSSSAAKKLYGEGTEAALAMAQDGVTAIDDTSKGLTKILESAKSSKVGAKIVDAAESSKSTLAKYADNFVDFISKKFKSVVGEEIGNSIDDIISKFKGGISKLTDKVAKETGEKVAAEGTAKTAGAAATLGLSELAFATIGAINGVSGTAKLFKCEKDDVDGTMRLISGIFGALTGTTLGSIIDIILSVVSACIGVDILNALAVAMYNKIVGEDSEKAQKLAESQANLESDWSAEKDTKIAEQYETQKKAGLISDDVSLEDFTEGINDGTYEVDYEGFDNYNTRVNASLGDKIISGVGKGVKSVGFGISKGVQKLITGEKSLVDSNGNVYTKNKDGSYQVTSADGEDLGYVSKEAIPSDATEQRQDSLLMKGAKGIASGVKTAGTKIADVASTAVSGLKTGFTNVKDGIGNAVEKIGNVFKNVGVPTLAYIKGDADTVSFDIPEDNPGKPLVDAVGKVLQFFTTPARGVISIGKTIGNTIGNAVTSAKNNLMNIGSAGLAYIKGESDDISLTDSEGLSPLGVIGNIEKFMLTPARGIVSIGKTVGATISSAVTSAKENIANMGSAGLAYIKGESDDISLTDSEGLSPLGVIGNIEKFMLTPARGIVSIGKAISGFFGDIGEVGSDIGEQAKAFIVGDSDSINLNVEEDNIFSSILTPIQKILQAVLSPIRLIGKAFGAIGDTITNIKDGVEDKINTVKDAVGNAWDTVKDKASGVVDSVKGAWNWVTGGDGTGIVRGGRGTLNGGTYYSQADPRWANSAFGNDDATMNDTGCGPTAAAMALSDVTGREISPTEMANLAEMTGNRDETGTNWNFMNQASMMNGVSSTQTVNPNAADIDGALSTGNPVILSGTSGGYGANPYTPAGHYVVAVGKDKNGNVIVNDPRGAGYSGRYNINDLARTTGSAWSFGGNGAVAQAGLAGGVSTKTSTKSKTSTSSSSNSTGANGLDWLSTVKACKQSIGNQNKGYSQSGYIDVTVNGKTINTRRDCSGFVSVCLSFYTGKKLLTSSSGFLSDSSVAEYLKSAGFSKYNWPGWSGVKAGDIYVIKGHVEICASDNSKQVYNCGSNSSCNNPGVTSSGHSAYTYVWRPGSPGTGGMDYSTNGVSAGTSSDGSNSSSSGSTSVLSTLGSFISSFATKAMNGLFTGNWDTDYSDVFGGTSSSDSSGSTVDDSSITPANISGSDTAKNVWNYFTNAGYSKAATAGIMGNLYQESGMNPASIQGNGKGPAAGIAQWENYNTKSGRWANLNKYATGKGKQWTDLGSQLEFIDSELKGLGSFWKCAPNMAKAGTTATDYSTWKASTDVSTATRQFEGGFERAGKPAMDNRVSAAKKYYELYAGNGGSGVGRKGGFGSRNYGPTQRRIVRGGRGADVSYNSSSAISSSNASSQYSTAMDASDYITVTKDSSMTEIMINCVKILSQIASNTGSTSSKLDMLQNLSNSTYNISGTTNVSGSTGSTQQKTIQTSTKAASTAQKIARGGY